MRRFAIALALAAGLLASAAWAQPVLLAPVYDAGTRPLPFGQGSSGTNIGGIYFDKITGHLYVSDGGTWSQVSLPGDPGNFSGGLCTTDAFGNLSCQDGGFAGNVTVNGFVDAGTVVVAANGAVYFNGPGGSDKCYDSSGTLHCAALLSADGQIITPSIFVSTSGNVVGNGGVLNLAGQSAATAVGIVTTNSTTMTAGGKLVSFRNNGVEQLSLGYNGLLNLFGTAPRRQGSYQINLSADTSFTALGLPGPSALTGGGTCTPAADTSNSAYQMIKYPTDGTVNHACGFTGPYTEAISPTYLPLLYVVAKSDPTAVTNTRVYIGMTKSDLSAVTTLAGANTINGAYFRFDSAIGDTDLMAESSDGTTASATDTTVAYSSATTYVLEIDNSVSGEADYYVNGVLKVAKVSNITTAYQALGLMAGITNITSGAARALSVSKVILLEN